MAKFIDVKVSVDPDALGFSTVEKKWMYQELREVILKWCFTHLCCGMVKLREGDIITSNTLLSTITGQKVATIKAPLLSFEDEK